jgi:hypothetical protein
MLLIHTPDRPDIHEAGIQTIGVPVGNTRGARIQAVIHYTDGTTETVEFDTLAGWDPTQGLGGWQPDSDLLGNSVANAVAWLHDLLVPPCSPIAS